MIKNKKKKEELEKTCHCNEGEECTCDETCECGDECSCGDTRERPWHNRAKTAHARHWHISPISHRIREYDMRGR